MISKVLTAAAFLLFAYTAVTILQLYFLSVSTNIPGGWDARYFWSLKAKFMFRSPENWQLIFSPKLPWSNPGYPLLWPNTLVWGWEWSGRESMIWSPIVSFVFYIASTFLLVWYLSSYSSAATGWLAGSFFMVLIPPLFWTLNQYADTPVTFFMTAGGFMLASALRSKNTRLLGISGLMGGLAAWTKNEGLIFLAWIYCIWATLSVFQGKKGDRVWRELKALCAGASVPLFAVLILKYLSRNSRTPAVIPHQSLANLSILLTSGAEQAWTIARSFYNDMKLFAPWKGLWGFFLLAAIFLALRKERLKSQGGILLFTVLLINAGYFAVLMLTSPDLLSWQIRTALDRLVIHTSILATAFAFETLTFGRSVPQK